MKDSISGNGGAERFWRHGRTGMRAVLCRNGAVLVSRGGSQPWNTTRLLTVEAIALDAEWHSDTSLAAQRAITRTVRAARRR